MTLTVTKPQPIAQIITSYSGVAFLFKVGNGKRKGSALGRIIGFHGKNARIVVQGTRIANHATLVALYATVLCITCSETDYHCVTTHADSSLNVLLIVSRV